MSRCCDSEASMSLILDSLMAEAHTMCTTFFVVGWLRRRPYRGGNLFIACKPLVHGSL
jgi:hypothetical protein